MSRVLMLHSGGMSGRQWRKLAETLSPTFEVETPDFLGYGSNPPWPSEQNFEIAQDIERIRQNHLQASEPVHLVGHSYGGLVALLLSLQNPECVASLALYDPVAFGVLYDQQDSEGLADLSRATEDPIFLDDLQGGGEAWMTTFVNYWNGAGYWQALPESSRAAFLQVGRKVYLEVRSLGQDRTTLEAYRKLSQPALLVYGEKSPAAARRVLHWIAQAMPQSQLVGLADAGHMGPLTHAGAFGEMVLQHLKRAT